MSCFDGSAMLTAEGAYFRVFEVAKCGYNVSLPSVYPIFAAHQVEWNLLGKTMPWWSVLSGQDKTVDINEPSKVEFYRSGSTHVATVAPAAGLAGKRVLDFGCGLGRLAFAFANDFGASVTCVDQSVHHLKVAEAQWGQRRKQGDVEIVVSSPDLLASVGSRRFDFVHSVITLQHMVPALQIIYLEQFCDVLKVNGTGWVQIPHKVPGFEGCDLGLAIQGAGFQMHATPMHAIRKALHRRGCAVKVEDVGTEHVGGEMRSAVAKFKKKEHGVRF